MMVIFDLDNTVFSTSDKYGNHIWSKQMIQPFRHEVLGGEERIIDDVGSVCRLLPDVKTFIRTLSNQNYKLGYLSNGRSIALSDSQQPTLLMLEIFGLLEYFNSCRILQYKTGSKVVALSELFDLNSCLVLDDDDQHILAFRDAGTRVIDVKITALTMDIFNA